MIVSTQGIGKDNERQIFWPYDDIRRNNARGDINRQLGKQSSTINKSGQTEIESIGLAPRSWQKRFLDRQTLRTD